MFFINFSGLNFENFLLNLINKKNISNVEVISDDKIKNEILKKSIFAVVKSGTVSLEICNAKVPSIIIYKMNFLNFLIVKMLVKIKFANIINIAANIYMNLVVKSKSNVIFSSWTYIAFYELQQNLQPRL